MKVVHPFPDEPSITVVSTFPDDVDVASNLASPVGVGNPFLVFESLPPAIEGNPAADFGGAPVVSEDEAVNQAAIDEMLANPPLSRVFEA